MHRIKKAIFFSHIVSLTFYFLIYKYSNILGCEFTKTLYLANLVLPSFFIFGLTKLSNNEHIKIAPLVVIHLIVLISLNQILHFLFFVRTCGEFYRNDYESQLVIFISGVSYFVIYVILFTSIYFWKKK